MRNRCKGRFQSDVAQALARHYDRLLRECHADSPCSCGALERADVFHETILYVAHDPRSRDFRTDDELLAHFLYCYRMICYQSCKDEKQHTLYADYLKTPEGNKA